MVFDAVKNMLATQLDVEADTITMDTKIIDDLRADSIDIVEMLMALEDEYGIEISDEDKKKNDTLRCSSNAKFFLACKNMIPTFNKYEFFCFVCIF